MIQGAVRIATCTAAIAVLAACTTNKPAPVVTVTVPPTSQASTPPSSTSSTAPATSASALPHQTKLPGDCGTLLPHFDVTSAIHTADVAGADAFVVGQPDKGIGRIAYLNCRYGVTGHGDAATPKIEIGISLYSTAARAAARVAATVDDYTGHGATDADTVVASRSGHVLTGGAGAGYDVPLAVVASGQRTVAVSIDPAVATGATATKDAVALAALALHRTGG
jgi:hypothetical protein